MVSTGVHEDPRWRIESALIIGANLRDVVDAIARDARLGCPIDKGDLLASIHPDVPSETEGFIVVGTDHWAPTEYGSRPHIIRSHGNYPLRNRETGEVFGRVVHHPGTPEQPFMRPALYRRRALHGVI